MDFNTILEQINLTNIGLVLQLAILEGLLSFDNALALAALVSGRLQHPEDRKHALLWGIWGAYVLRIGIVFVGVWLMKHEWVKFMAGGYLVWLAVNELFLKKPEKTEHGPEAHELIHDVQGGTPTDAEELAGRTSKIAAAIPRASFKKIFGVIVAVELMDLMFSIDSIAVALAVSDEKWVLVTGAIIGILMMRVAAQFFIKLIDRFPVLVPTAFILVGIAGLKVVLEVTHLEFGSTKMQMLGLHVPEYVFLPIMFSILIGSMLLNHFYPEKFKPSH